MTHIPSISAQVTFECSRTGITLLRPSCNLETVKDGRGAILTWIPPEPIVEFNLLEFRPSTVRGLHYHSHFVEYSMCVRGTGMFVYREDAEDSTSEASLFISKGFVVRIPSGVVHTIYSIDELTLVAMLTNQWDKSEPPIVQVGTIPKPERIG
jgi:dTDP-4-dehydrorhamnose 3,5-epimerase-like enzyme